MSTESRVGVFIDSDNISACALKYAWPAIKEIGGIVCAKAYGDWEDDDALTSMKAELEGGDIEFVQQKAYSKRKNATDIALSVGCVHSVLKEKLNIVILFSGDSDFAPLTEYLLSQGVYVIGVGGENNTSEAFKKICSKYLFIEDLANLSPEFKEESKSRCKATMDKGECRKIELRALMYYLKASFEHKGKSPHVNSGDLFNFAKSEVPGFRTKGAVCELREMYPNLITESSFEIIHLDLSALPLTEQEKRMSPEQRMIDALVLYAMERIGKRKVALFAIGKVIREIAPELSYRELLGHKKIRDCLVDLYSECFFNREEMLFSLEKSSDRVLASLAGTPSDELVLRKSVLMLAQYVKKNRGDWLVISLNDAVEKVLEYAKKQCNAGFDDKEVTQAIQKSGLFSAFNFDKKKEPESMILSLTEGRTTEERRKAALAYSVVGVVNSKVNSLRFESVLWVQILRRFGENQGRSCSLRETVRFFSAEYADYFSVNVSKENTRSAWVSLKVGDIDLYEMIEGALGVVERKLMGTNEKLTREELYAEIFKCVPWLESNKWLLKSNGCFLDVFPQVKEILKIDNICISNAA